MKNMFLLIYMDETYNYNISKNSPYIVRSRLDVYLEQIKIISVPRRKNDPTTAAEKTAAA